MSHTHRKVTRDSGQSMVMRKLFVIDNRIDGPLFQWSKDSNILAVSGSKKGVILVSRQGKLMKTIPLPEHGGRVTGLEWDNQSELLAIRQQTSAVVLLWIKADPDNLEEVATGHKDLTFMLWSRKFSQLALGTQKGEVLVYDRPTKGMIRVKDTRTQIKMKIVCGAWNNQNHLVTCGEDKKISVSHIKGLTDITIADFEVAGGVPTEIVFGTDEMERIVMANLQGKFLLANNTSKLHPYELSFKERYGDIVTYKWFCDRYVLIGFSKGFCMTISILVIGNTKERSRVQFHQESLSDVAYCPALRKGASVGDNIVCVFDIDDEGMICTKGWKCFAFEGEKDSLTRVEWTEDGQVLTVLSKKGNLYTFSTLSEEGEDDYGWVSSETILEPNTTDAKGNELSLSSESSEQIGKAKTPFLESIFCDDYPNSWVPIPGFDNPYLGVWTLGMNLISVMLTIFFTVNGKMNPSPAMNAPNYSFRTVYIMKLWTPQIFTMGMLSRITTDCIKEKPVEDRRWTKTFYTGACVVLAVLMMFPILRADEETNMVYEMTGLTCILLSIVACAPSVYIVTRWAMEIGNRNWNKAREQPRYKWWHASACCGFLLVEVGSLCAVKSLTAYVQSEFLQSTPNFLLLLSALFIRRAAELSVLPSTDPSELSTLGIGLGMLFVRFAQNTENHSAVQVMSIELTYTLMRSLSTLTLYLRSLLVSEIFHEECRLQKELQQLYRLPLVRKLRMRPIESACNACSFIVAVLFRFGLSLTDEIVGGVIVCLLLQAISDLVAFRLIRNPPRMHLEDLLVPKTAPREMWLVLNNFYIFGLLLVFGCY